MLVKDRLDSNTKIAIDPSAGSAHVKALGAYLEQDRKHAVAVEELLLG